LEDTNQVAAPEQGAAQSDNTGTTQGAPEQSAPAKSANETKLERQLADVTAKRDTYKKERDTARTDLAKVSKERDALLTENEQLQKEKEAAAQASAPTSTEVAATEAAQEPTQEEYIKDLLRRNGLQKAWMLTSGPCFSEEHAKEFAGPEFNSLTVISLEENAGSK
jgi:Tfp pilus assembly protein FimV